MLDSKPSEKNIRSAQQRSRRERREPRRGKSLSKSKQPASSRSKPDRKARDRRWHLLRYAKKVGLTRELVSHIQKRTPKECAICGRKAEVLDHCHQRMEHRGRLCHRCNTALGLFQDDVQRLTNAIWYLEQFDLQFTEIDQ